MYPAGSSRTGWKRASAPMEVMNVMMKSTPKIRACLWSSSIPASLRAVECGEPRARSPAIQLGTGVMTAARVRHEPQSGGDVSTIGNIRWSLYGAQRSQRVATGGKRSSCETAQTSGKPLPSVATSCRRSSMVRRGSTVRVRQRALQKYRKAGLSLSDRLAHLTTCIRYGADYGAFRSGSASLRPAFSSLYEARAVAGAADRARRRDRLDGRVRVDRLGRRRLLPAQDEGDRRRGRALVEPVRQDARA